MKRRFVSILMALVMALSLLPAQALADDNTVTELNKNNISNYVTNGLGNGTYKLTEDVTITGTLTITGDTTLDLNNRVLQMTNNSGVFKIENGGHLTIKDSNPTAVHKFIPDNNGLWVLDEQNGTKTVSGGIITGGTGCKIPTGSFRNTYGGGVYVDGGGQFTMTGGNIVGCKAEGDIAYGGGVFVAKGGQFTMSGGSITGCTAVATTSGSFACGGGIRSEGSTTLSGTAEIRDCHAKCANAYIDTSYGGGISDGHIDGSLSISGNVQIIGCTAGESNSDAMYIIDRENRSISGGTFYGSINSTKKISGHIVTYQLNNENYATQVVPSDDTTSIPDPDKPNHTFSGWYKDGTLWDSSTPVTENITLTGWLYAPVRSEKEFTDALADNSIDVIRLTDNITLQVHHPPTAALVRNGRQLTLDLNGYVLDLGNTEIAVGAEGNGSMTIMDSRPNEPHKFTPDPDGLWVWDKGTNTGTETVLGGVITSSESSSFNAISVSTNGQVIMTGGNIVGHETSESGAVSIVAGGQFTMNAGSIAGCKASDKGGGVYLLIGTFELAGGVIKSCKAGNKGGAVYVGNRDGIFTMTGGSIEGCKAANGSALCLYGKMEANGGTVDGTVVLDTKNNNGTHTGIIQGSGTNATQFNGTVTNKGTISHGTFNGTVENTGMLTGGTYNGLIRNGNPNAKFGNVNSPLGIVENKPGTGSSTYHTVTFAPAESTMDNTTRYFLNGGKISSEIKPASRTGYTFNGWYNGETKWDHTNDKVTGDLTLTAHWTGNTYTVTLDPNGGTVNPATITATYGADLPTMPVPVYPGYAFTGWYDAQTGGKRYGDKTGASTSRYDKTENCTLYAQWMSCDHSGSTAKPTCTIPATCTVCGGTIEKLGHNWGDWTPSSNKTHTRTCKTDSTHTETKNCADDNKDHVCDTCGATLTQHSGGTATCAAPATCGYCGKPYGEKNPANHSDLKHVPAKAATTQAEGNSEYWLCSGCGKCYKDAAAATEIALSDTVIAKRIPRRYSGPTITVMGAAYYDGGNVGLTFVSSADFDTFTGVQVDGKTLAAKNYIAERGSIEVYLKAVYLRTLKNGSHTVTIQSTAGDVSAVFTVENSKTSPGTSDPGVAVYALSSMLSLTGLAALRRRKED